jgi:hypothetical protein
VKVLLDECVDRRFARDLVGHEVTTVQKRGWSGIKNGDLLALAEKEFDAFITVDRKLSIQQDLTKFRIPVLRFAHARTGSNAFGLSQGSCLRNFLGHQVAR